MQTSPILYAGALMVSLAAAPVRAQEPPAQLSLQEALELFGQNSPELRIARSRLRSALGSALQGRAIPNPIASITNEDLGPYSERYFNLSQRVDFVWEGGSRSRRAEARASGIIAITASTVPTLFIVFYSVFIVFYSVFIVFLKNLLIFLIISLIFIKTL